MSTMPTTPAIPEAAVIVDGRLITRGVEALAMLGDEKDMPAPWRRLDASKPDGWWVGVAHFLGIAYPGGESNQLRDATSVDIAGPFCLAVSNGRVIGIISPEDVLAPALWWSWPLSSVRIEPVGSKGVLKKRPSAIVLTNNTDSLRVALVARVHREQSGGMLVGNEEGSLLDRLSFHARHPVPLPRRSVDPSAIKHVEWHRDASIAGLYRQMINGAPAPRVQFSDRNAPRRQQLDQLADAFIDWLPDYALQQEFENIVFGRKPSADPLDLPAATVVGPVAGLAAIINTSIDLAESSHRLRRYLWPVLTSDHQLLLEPGETVLSTLPIPPPKDFSRKALGPDRGTSYLILTNQRVVAISGVSAPGAGGTSLTSGDYLGGSRSSKSSFALDMALPTGPIGPSASDMLAHVRAKKRARSDARRSGQEAESVRNLCIVGHLLHEWITRVSTSLKLLAEARETPSSAFGGFSIHYLNPERSEGGMVAEDRLEFDLGFSEDIEGKRGDLTTLAHATVQAIHLDASLQPLEMTTETVDTAKGYSGRPERRITTNWPFAGAKPRCTPASLLTA